MKTYWAFVLPVLLATLAGTPSKARAQWALAGSTAPAGGSPSVGDRELPPSAPRPPGAAPASQQVPLGVRSMLGAPPAPEGFGPGVVPASYGAAGAPGMMPGPMPGMGAPGMMPGMAGPGMPGMGGPGMMPGMGGPGMMPGGMPPQGVMPASYESMGGYPAMGGCQSCGGAGCPTCMNGGLGGHVESGFDLFRYLLPYPGGGWCSPRWFDVSVEFVYLGRDEVSDTVNLISDGPAGLGAPNVVLSTDDLSFDERPGFRASAAYQIGSSGNIEFTYMGTFNWSESASVTSDFDELYSAFSDFGTDPGPAPGVLPGFQDTDAAEFASIGYSSSIDSFELGFRRRWMFPNCRIQGSWLAGARYFRLEEEFQHLINVDYDQAGPIAPFTGGLDYLVATDNSMTGFQLGGDLWATLFPGVMLGVDGRAGVYGNRAEQNTFIGLGSSPDKFWETDDRTRTSFVGETSFLGLWRVNQHLTLRGGYEVLYVEGVALAPENMNFDAPFTGRSVFVNDDGNVLYHGFTAGLEWLW